MPVKESCPYCGEMTEMVEVIIKEKGKVVSRGNWISGTCHCGKKIDPKTLGVPELIEDKPDLKAPEGVELP